VAQPTVAIGVGGTGQRVLTLVKSFFAAAHGGLPDDLALLCFDSANDPVSYANERDGAVVRLEAGSEFYLFDPVPVVGIKRYPERHVEIYDALGPHAINRINRAYITHGAAQDRTQGYLALLWNGKQVERIIADTLHRLTERDQDLHHELDTSNSLQVFVVASVAGGQGSGAAQALAHISAQQLTDLSTLGERGKITGMFVLPGAFHGIETLQMQANAQAFAEEVNALMLATMTSNVHYPGSDPIRTADPPFDYVYVFDGVDENGKTWPNLDEVCSLAARLIWLLSSSQVGAKEINAMINKTGVLLNVSGGGFGTYLATAGQATIRFPAANMAERCAARQARNVLAQLLQGANQEAAPDAPASGVPASGVPAAGVLARQAAPAAAPKAISLAYLREQVSTNDEGAPYQARVTTPAAFEQMPVNEIPGKAHLMVDGLLRRRVEQETFAQIQQKKTAVTATITGQLQATLAGSWVGGRLPEAFHYLRQNRMDGQQALALAASDLEKLAQLEDQDQAALVSAATALEKSAEGFLPFFRRAQVRSALSTYIAEANTLAQRRIERRIAEATADALRACLAWLDAHLRMAESAVARMAQAQEWLAAWEAELARRSGGRTEITLDDAQLVDYLFGKFAVKATVDAPGVMAQLGDLAAWRTLRTEDIGRETMTCVAASFAPIRALSVEDVLALHWSERSAQQWVARLETLAAAAWNPDRSLLKGGGVELASFLTIGVPDATASIFGSSGRTLVSTHDPERIIALRTVYGGSFDALKPAAQWKRALTRLGDRHPVYIYPHHQPHEDQSLLTFALGMAYGHIRSQVSWYYYHPEDTLLDPVRLGQGLEKAVGAFRDMTGVQAEVTARVQAEIAHEGNSRAATRIDTWIKGTATGDETLNKLRRAARDYVASLVPQTSNGKHA
jgi:hypothetical protein